MQEFKGTKGEWKIKGYAGQHDEAGASIQCNDEAICSTSQVRNNDWIEYEANANLIANAPKLLEALQNAYKCSGEKNYLTKPVLDEMLDAINSALGNEA